MPKKNKCGYCRPIAILSGKFVILLDFANAKFKTMSIFAKIVSLLIFVPLLLMLTPLLTMFVYIGQKYCQHIPIGLANKFVKHIHREDNEKKSTIKTKIMSFNTRACVNRQSIFNIEKTAESIKNANVSIVALQECTKNGQNGRYVGTTCIAGEENHEKEDQTKKLKDLTGMKHFKYFGVHNLSRGGTFGVAILSNYTILQTKTHTFKRWKYRDRRGALAVKVDLNELDENNKNIKFLGWFISTHLQNDVTGLEQEEEAAELVDFVFSLQEEDENAKFTVIMGDLNSTPDFSAPKLISKAFGPSLAEHFNMQNPAENPIVGTFPTFLKAFKIDYIWLYNHHFHKSSQNEESNNFLYPIKLQVLCNDEASDHYPMVSTLIHYGQKTRICFNTKAPT
jgi:endonuclease/exonuclease/phosphatase family metal-dependent hydrolase